VETSTKLILRKTRTAADYINTRSPNVLTRCRAAAVLRQLAAFHATANTTVSSAGTSVGSTYFDQADRIGPPTLRGLLAAVADCAGTGWLKVNARDPDVARLAALLDEPHRAPSDPAELDDLLATVLWASHGPQPN
jgi:hypothetical protein